MWWLLTLGQGMPVHREAAQNQWASSPLLQVFLHTFLSFLHRSLCPPPPGIDSPARQALGKLEGSALQPLPATALLRPSSPSQTSQGKKGSIFPRADGLQPAVSAFSCFFLPCGAMVASPKLPCHPLCCDYVPVRGLQGSARPPFFFLSHHHTSPNAFSMSGPLAPDSSLPKWPLPPPNAPYVSQDFPEEQNQQGVYVERGEQEEREDRKVRERRGERETGRERC
nr:uncharacterized protein LOC105722181 isoform X1 [Aotus nancymaae]